MNLEFALQTNYITHIDDKNNVNEIEMSAVSPISNKGLLSPEDKAD